MIICTSIAPNSENSIEAVKSWAKYGKIYSLNSEEEISRIGGDAWKDVTFVPTHRIMKWNNRPLVSVNAMIDLAIEKDEDLVIINSDIIIGVLPEFNQDGITILTRCDYDSEGTFEQGRLYDHGYDLFFIPKHFLKQFPMTIYCLGNTWNDYALPYFALTNGILVYWPQGKSIFHKTHSFQWDFDEWQTMGEFFKLLFKMDRYTPIEQVATNILADIKNRSIK